LITATGSDVRASRSETLRSAEQGAVIEGARDLVRLAHRHGYRLDELIEVIQTVG
jgi:hypothetical protein